MMATYLVWSWSPPYPYGDGRLQYDAVRLGKSESFYDVRDCMSPDTVDYALVSADSKREAIRDFKATSLIPIHTTLNIGGIQ